MRIQGVAYWIVGVVFVAACAAPVDDRPLAVALSDEPALSSTDAPGLAVRLTFNGESAWFVFDTGAGAHTLARWFVDRAGLSLVEGPGGELSARDATGAPVELQIVRNQVGELGDGHRIHLAAAVVASFPPEFEKAEIGGLLNPQLLAQGEGAVVLDFRVPELRLEPSFSGAVRRLGARSLADAEVRECRSADAPVPNLVFAIRVRSGRENGWLMIDTGTNATTLIAASRLVESVDLGPGGATTGVAGVRQEHRTAAGLALAFAGHRAIVDAQVVEAEGTGCGPDGVLGLDALATCALVFDDETLAVACGA